MSDTKALFDAMTTTTRGLDGNTFATAVDALRNCEEAVTACSAAMLAESEVSMFVSAVAADLDCADVAAATRRVLIRRSGSGTALLSAQLEACLVACRQSNDLCAPHASHHDHCRLCADATRRCSDVCRELLATLHN